MKNLRSVFWFMLLGVSNMALAQRYEIYEGVYGPFPSPEAIGNFIMFVGGSIAAYYYLAVSYSEWYLRKKMTREERANDVKANLFIAIIGYLIVAIFLSIPIFFIIKIFGGYDLFAKTRFYVIGVAFAILTYLRRA